jgi:fimbrial chaperone protein
MNVLRKIIDGAIRAAAVAAIAMAAPALATTVSPVVVDMQSTGRGVVANISVENTAANPLPVEIKVETLTAGPSGLAGTGQDSGDLLVVPPMAIIPAGQTQTFRVQWVGDPELVQSKHFYVTVAQLPVEMPAGESAVQVLYNFQVLVNVSAPGKKPELAIQSASIGTHDGKPAPIISVANRGAAHGYVSKYRLKIVQNDASGREIFSKVMSGPEFQQSVGYGLVASNQVRNIPLPMALPSREGTVTATLSEEGSR